MEFYLDLSDKRLQILETLLNKKTIHTHKISSLSDIFLQKSAVFVFSPAKKWTQEEILNLPKNIHLFCGNVEEKYLEIFKQKNIKYVNFNTDENFAIANAQLTAEGVLALLIENTEKSIFENKILLLGAGRITKACAMLFEKLGLDFHIATFNKKEYENSYFFTRKNYFEYNFVKDIQDFDVIINTRPTLFIDQKIIEKIKADTLFIETASKNCLNSQDVKKFTYLPAPALPKRFCAQSASKLMLNKILGDLGL